MAAAGTCFGEWLPFGAEPAAPLVLQGFSFAEAWGRWTEGGRARLTLRHGATAGLLLVELRVARSFCRADEPCDIVLCAGWGEPKLFSLSSGATRLAFVTAVMEAYRPGQLELEILIASPKLPDEPPADARRLGVGLEAVRLRHLFRRESIPAIALTERD